MAREITFNNSIINDNSSCYVIAEIGNNHQGDVNNAKKLIEEAKNSGASAVKFQRRDNKELFTTEMFESPYVGPQSFASTYGEHRDKLELSDNDFEEIFKYSKKVDIDFFVTPFDMKSADFLNELGLDSYKIASGDLTNFPLIEKVANFQKPMIISTGASDFWEVEKTLNFAKNINPNIILLQCTSIYPAKPITINLNVINTFRKEFPETVIGYSGHDSGISIPIAAYSLGARVIEKHFTLDRSQKGTDHQFSLTAILLKSLIDELENVRLSFGDGKKKLLSEEKLARFKMGKKIIASKKLPKGTVIKIDDLLFKSPGDGVPPSEIDKVIGKTTTKDYSFEENIKLEDLN